MPDASNLQSNFHGGEWSPFTQGRMDRPDYRQGMTFCINTIPLEEAAATRRPGFRRLGYTRAGQYASLREFHFNSAEPYLIELTNLHLRLWGGSPLGLNSSALIMKNELLHVAAISTANPAVVDTTGVHGFSTGDTVIFRQPDGATSAAVGRLLNRQFYVTVTDTDSFSITDSTTAAGFDGSVLGPIPAGLSVARIYDQVTPWTTAQVPLVRVVQDNRTLAMFQEGHAPRRLIATVLPSDCVNAEFTFNTGLLLDGPYFDAFTDGTTATPSALGDSITLTASASKFAAGDVGRAVRLFSEPPEWSAVTAYAPGDAVRKFDDYYTALEATTGDDPFSSPTKWLVNPSAARWSWGFITGYTSPTVVTVDLDDGLPLLYLGPIRTWRLGLYSDTTGWPTGGVFHDGRLWIWGNVIPNRIDGSKSNEGLAYDSIGVFSPTGWDGTVADNNAVAAVFRSTDVNPIYWAISDDQGLICGTKAGEWLIRSGGGADDAITPTSIRAKRVTKYGGSNVEPTRVGDAIMFVNRFNRKLYEYMADASASSPRYSASNLTLKAKHLTATGIAEIAYQQELVPILWLRTLAGALIGCTYKKDGQYNGIREDIQAWHQHAHGDAGRLFEAIQGGPTGQGLDTLYASTFDPTTGYRQIEQLSLIFGQNAEAATGNFLDGSVVPTAAEIVTVGPGEVIRYYGLDHMEGIVVTAWVAGLDMGEFTVTGGVIDVPLAGAVSQLTRAKLTDVTTGSSYFGLAVNISSGSSTLAPATPDTTGITEYQPGGETLGAPGDQYVYDYVANKVYVVSDGHSTTGSGFRRYNGTTGVLEQYKTAFQILGVNNAFHNTSLGGIDANGNLYFVADSSNHDAIFKVRGSDLTLQGTYGDPDAGTGFVNGNEFAALTIAGRTVVVHAGFFVGSGSAIYLDLLDADAMTAIGTSYSLQGSQKFAFLAHGPVLDTGCGGSGSCFAAGYVSGASAATFGLYAVDVTASGSGIVTAGFREIDQIQPADIDASWTTFADGAVASFNVDQTDGNLLAVVRSAAGPTVTTYLVKFNASTGDVMWKLANHNPDLAGGKNSVIKQGGFSYKSATGVSGVYPVYNINTLTGLVSSTGQAVDVSGTTRWDGVHGFMFGRGSYSHTHTGYPIGTNTVAFSDSYYRFAGSAGGGSLTDYKAPASIGFTYTSRGQLLRPINDAGAGNGPALGKTRRAHMYAILLQRSGPLKLGTDFVAAHLRPVPFADPGGTAYVFGRLYSGIVQDTLEDDYSFNGQVAWEYTRPVPGTVLAVETFLYTQDR